MNIDFFLQRICNFKLSKYTSTIFSIKDLYERDVIQGRTDAKSFIEKMVDVYLDNLKLDSFTEKEMIELKKFFVETKEQMKKYNEQKEKRKNKQMEKLVTNIMPGRKK